MNNLLRTLVFDGQVSLTLADTTEIVQEGARLHNLSKDDFEAGKTYADIMSQNVENLRKAVS